MRARVGGEWKEVESGRVYVGGAWKQLSEVRAYISGAWETIATFVPDLSASVSPGSVSGTRSGAGLVTTNATTATPAGGGGPYTYSWARVGSGTGIANSPSSATTTFRRTMGADETVLEVWRVTVTDTYGTTATADVNVTFTSVTFD